ncbi:LysE family transporter [Sphaerothrix gracilis]|uniref:LysE family transporter n=1 Tax=Sphaerothrix gracilis TaxID=3151835 RepID=UPI0031FD6100
MLFFTALLLGLIFNAAPGAVFAETIRQGIRGGFKSALAVQIGSLVGDALWAVLGLAGVGLLLQLDFLRLPIGISGVFYLLWLAWDAWQEANREFSVRSDEATNHDRKALRSGVLLSITNPQNIAYWAALGSAMGAVGVTDPTAKHYLIFFAGFMVSSILWSFFCAGLVSHVFGKAGIRWARLTYRACAIAFLLLALSSLRNLWDSHLVPQDPVQPPAVHGEP